MVFNEAVASQPESRARARAKGAHAFFAAEARPGRLFGRPARPFRGCARAPRIPLPGGCGFDARARDSDPPAPPPAFRGGGGCWSVSFSVFDIETMPGSVGAFCTASTSNALRRDFSATCIFYITRTRTSTPRIFAPAPNDTLQHPPLLHSFDVDLAKTNIHRFISKLYEGSTYMF